MSGITLSIRATWFSVGMLLAFGSGCTSALSTAALREALWVNGDHAAESDAEASDPAAGASATREEAVLDDVADAVEPVDAERRAAAVDEAVNRLARLGPLDAATKATLIETLHRTAQEDWPVVVEAFATTLEATGLPAPRPAAAATSESHDGGAESHVVAKADLDAEPTQRPPVPVPVPAESSTTVTEPTSPVDLPSPSAVIPSAEAEPSLAVRNACFASRVHAWGVVDRFAADAFRPGQELIVYFELDNLSASESPTGHTTCIDTSLTLVDGRGHVVHDWSFEPIAETCRSRRRDYFARYVVRLPTAVPPGGCKLELAVVDTLTGTTARETLPLAIVEAAAPD
jgi:hypothetical protein